MVTQQSFRIALFAFAITFTASNGLFAQQTAHVNKQSFRIPYHIDPMVAAQLKPKEVQLHVSNDHGKTWEQSATAEPSITHFRFSAKTDGEYWFDVKTVDSKNQVHPRTAGYAPSLKVVVDTTSPKITLNLSQVDSRKAGIQWSVEDPGLLLDTLALEYQEPGSTQWQPMGIVAAGSGGTMWSFSRNGIAAVRCTAKDKAGNVAIEKKTVNLAVIQKPPVFKINQVANQTANPAPGPGLSLDFGQQPGQQPTLAVGSEASYADASYPDTSGISLPNTATPQPGMPANTQITHAPVLHAPGIQMPNVQMPNPRMQNGHAPDSHAHNNQMQVNHPQHHQDSASLVGQQSGMRPTTGNDNFKNPNHQMASRTQDDLATQPTARKHRVVNLNAFQINYKMDGLGPSGVSRVEFFITENDGLKWWKYGDDKDRQSPFRVRVPHDGVFGFAIRLSSGAGLAGDAPMRGEKPEVVIEVDTTQPVVSLKPFDPNSAPGTRALKIGWSAYDANLADLPVGLYFAPQKTGPWESISGWVANSGEYTWNVGPEVPTSVFLRIAARDTAGNITQLDTQNPIIVDTARPSARIVDVQTFGAN